MNTEIITKEEVRQIAKSVYKEITEKKSALKVKVGDLVLNGEEVVTREDYEKYDYSERYIIGIIALFDINGNPLYITKYNFNQQMKWKTCKDIVPTLAQLRTIWENKELIEYDWLKFKDFFYWSSSQNNLNIGYAWDVYFDNGYVFNSSKYDVKYVCCLRALTI